MSQAHLSATAALIAHLESATTDQRVLLVGHSDSSLPEALLERGARLVHVLDEESKRVSECAARNKNPRISYAQLTDSALRDGSYGLSIVEDLSLLEAPRTVCEKIAKTIRPSGLVVISTSAQAGTRGLLGQESSALEYADLVAWSEENFETVRTLGQTPFVGYSVVHFDLENPPEPSLDNGFVEEGDEAEAYITLCGSEEAMNALELEDMTIVQLPGRRVLDQRHAAEESRSKRDRRQIQDLQAELKNRSAGRHADSEKLVAEIESRDEKLFALKKELATQKRRADDAEAELDRVEEELAEAAEEASAPEQPALNDLQPRLEEAERNAARSKKEAKWAEERVRKLEKELEQVLREAEEKWADASNDDANEELRDLRNTSQALKQERNALIERERVAKSDADKLREQLERAKLEAVTVEKRSRRTQVDYEKTQAKLLEEKSAARDAQKEIEELAREVDSLGQKLHDAEDDADHFYALAKQRQVKLDTLSAKLEKATSQSTAPRPNQESKKAHSQEVTRLEEQLKERGHALRKAETELQKLQDYCQGLLAERALAADTVEEKSDKTRNESEAAAISKEELEQLGEHLAKTEAELVAARWTIGQLKQEVVKT